MYIAFEDGIFQYDYVVMADIRRGEEAGTRLHEGIYSYDSMLEWYSYRDWLDSGAKIEDDFRVKIISELHDSIYGNAAFYAIYDYLDRTGKDKKSLWQIDDNDTYIGRNGYIVCANCSNGIQDVIFLVDVWNKTYAVVE